MIGIHERLDFENSRNRGEWGGWAGCLGQVIAGWIIQKENFSLFIEFWYKYRMNY